VGFGLFFVFLGQTDPGSRLWPLFSARVASVVRLGAGLVFTRRPAADPIPQRWFYTWCAGILDALAGAAFLLSTFTGSLSVVSMLSSLYPGVTVLLAWQFDKERFSRSQLAGICLAAASITLLA
jgi:drug/metabolite transporter (DMT)-like permease